MKPYSRYETASDLNLRVLIADLKLQVNQFAIDVCEEEKRTNIFDVDPVERSMLAERFRARRDNLVANLIALEDRLDRRHPVPYVLHMGEQRNA